MSEKKKTHNTGSRMSAADILPVICFVASMILIGLMFQSVIFIIGAIVCTLAGVGKILWKLILSVSDRDITVLDLQFWYLMLAGAVLIVVSVIVRQPFWQILWKNVSSFPCNILFVISIACFVVMGIMTVRLDPPDRKTNKNLQSINLFAEICMLLGIVIIWYASDSYPADAGLYLESTDSVQVTEIKNGLSFDGPGTDEALIFYPGAKVEYTAYAPLMMELADEGVDCFLIEMPYNMAIFGMGRADSIMSDNSYDNWYISGHSLGGAMAASYAARHTDQFDGVIVLGAYATKSLGDLPLLAVYGSEDDILDREKLEEGREDSTNYTEVCIEGGNHSGFGAYGPQEGDGPALISKQEQWEETKDAVLEMMAETKK